MTREEFFRAIGVFIDGYEGLTGETIGCMFQFCDADYRKTLNDQPKFWWNGESFVEALPKIRVLAIDDEPQRYGALENDPDFEVRIVNTSSQCAHYMSLRHKVDVVALDYDLNDRKRRSGATVADTWASRWVDTRVKVIVHTIDDYGRREIERTLDKFGVEHVYVEPYSSQLIPAIRKLVGRNVH